MSYDICSDSQTKRAYKLGAPCQPAPQDIRQGDSFQISYIPHTGKKGRKELIGVLRPTVVQILEWIRWKGINIFVQRFNEGYKYALQITPDLDPKYSWPTFVSYDDALSFAVDTALQNIDLYEKKTNDKVPEPTV